MVYSNPHITAYVVLSPISPTQPGFVHCSFMLSKVYNISNMIFKDKKQRISIAGRNSDGVMNYEQAKQCTKLQYNLQLV